MKHGLCLEESQNQEKAMKHVCKENLVNNTVFSGKVESGTLRHYATEEIGAVSCFSLKEIREMEGENKLRSGRASVQPIEDFLGGCKFPLNVFKRIKT